MAAQAGAGNGVRRKIARTAWVERAEKENQGGSSLLHGFKKKGQEETEEIIRKPWLESRCDAIGFSNIVPILIEAPRLR